MSTYETSSLYASWAQAILALITLGLAYSAYRKFLSHKLAENQLELVLKLIEAFANGKYRFEQLDKTIPGGPGSYALSFDYKNIFELATLHSRLDDLPTVPVFLPSTHSTRFNPSPFSYLNNPLLPNEIAKSMNQLKRNLIYIDEELANFKKYIIIGNKQLESQVEFVKVDLYEFEGGMGEFVKSCQKTTQAIIKWLDDYGLSDLNSLVLKPASENLFHSHFPEL